MTPLDSLQNTVETSREFEIKLLFPEEKFKPLEQWIISKGGVRRQHLQAAYIDTPEFLLAKSGVALRLRKEGRQWVQTLKIATANPLDRIEHNVPLVSSGAQMPSWSIDHHQHHQAGELLKKLLPHLSTENLRICYQTDVWRRKVHINTRNGILEYALDEGIIFTNSPKNRLQERVCELEIELIQGSPADVMRHAQAMVKRFKAYVDTRNKAERGYLLAKGLSVSPASRAELVSLKNCTTKAKVIHRLLDACLMQILPNQSALNLNGHNQDEHLHQLRVGLRRLKTLLKYLASNDLFLSPENQIALREAFQQLGEHRDDSYISGTLNPLMRSLSGPSIDLQAGESLPHPNLVTKSVRFQLLLLDIMLLRYSPSLEGEEIKLSKNTADNIRKPFVKTLKRAYQFCFTQSAQINFLEDEKIHELRKRLKFLRYSLEFFKDWFDKNKFKPFFKLLTRTLEELGQFNDICVAIHRIEPMTESNPQFFFALGWLKAERVRSREICIKNIKELMAVKTAW